MPKSIHRPENRVLTQLLRDMRISADMSQVELSRLLKRPQSFISELEGGKRRLDVLQVEEICLALGSTLSRLVAAYERAKLRPSSQSRKLT